MSHELGDSNSIAFSSGFILSSLEHKSILITGSTGFLAKIFIEKVLRVQPRVKKLYLLLRASEKTSATDRFQQEVIRKEPFSVLREQHGEGFDSFISSKVVPLAGDISSESLGIKDSELEQKMLKEIDFIVNIAANTNWEERYDVALSINTLGAKHVYEFAKKCQKLELLLHVSTAYVATKKEGLIFETPLRMGETYTESSATLDIEMELKIAEEQLKQLRREEATDGATTNFMKKLGMQRAKFHGWVNTYVFTKAMGEMLLGQLSEDYDVPVVIVRPTIITSTYRQPFPGWIEGFKTIDAVVQNYAKGALTHFVADPNSIMDVIPGDMVVNAMIVAMAAHCGLYPHPQGIIIYNVGSSTRNPIKYTSLTNWASDYFSMNPHMDINNNPIRVPRWTMLPSKNSFSDYLKQNYEVPLEALRAMKDLSFNKSSEYLYSKLNRQYILLIRLLEYFEPFVLFKGIFDSSNLEKLGATMKEEDLKDFDFDPKCINWEGYFKTVHFPGSTKYVFIRSRDKYHKLNFGARANL